MTLHYYRAYTHFSKEYHYITQSGLSNTIIRISFVYTLPRISLRVLLDLLLALLPQSEPLVAESTHMDDGYITNGPYMRETNSQRYIR